MDRELQLRIKVLSQVNELQKVINEMRKLGAETDKANKKGAGLAKDMRGLSTTFGGLVKAAAAFGAGLGVALGIMQLIQASAAAIKDFVASGIQFNSEMETTQIGMAAILSSSNKITTALGEQLEGQDKFNAALVHATKLQKELMAINLETPATYEEVQRAFLPILAASRAANINHEQALHLTKLIVNAVAGIGLGFNQIASESRDLLEGSINPMSSQLGNVLDTSNSMIKAAKEQGKLYEHLVDVLKEFELAGAANARTFQGLLSNTMDMMKIFSAQAFRPVFEYLKTSFQSVIDSIGEVKDQEIVINQKWVEIGNTISTVIIGAINATIFAVKLLGRAIDVIRVYVNGVHDAFVSLKGIIAEIATWVETLAGAISGYFSRVTTELGAQIEKGIGDIERKFGGGKGKHPIQILIEEEQKNKPVVDAFTEAIVLQNAALMEWGKIPGVRVPGLAIKNLYADLETFLEPIWKPPKGGKGSGAEAKKAADERARIAKDLLNKINEYTLSEYEYKILKINEEVEAARKAGVERGLIEKYRVEAIQELADEEFKSIKDSYEDVLKTFSIVPGVRLGLLTSLDDLIAKLDELKEERISVEQFLPPSEQLRREGERTIEILRALGARRKELESDTQAAILYQNQVNAKAIREARQTEYIQMLKDSGGFIDGLKAGWLEFAEAVQSNADFVSQFFADTLSNMSQNFSDLFYDVLTGKFDSLQDIAVNTFKAILRSFTDMVSAIVTRQIIISLVPSIGGATGGTGALGGASPLGTYGAGPIALATYGMNLTQPGFFSKLGASFGSLKTLLTGGFGAAGGFLSTLGAALPAIGTIATAIGGIIAGISALMKKKPRVSINMGVVDEVGDRLATYGDFLKSLVDRTDPLVQDIIEIGKGGKTGVDAGELRQKVIDLLRTGAIEPIAALIAKLPSDLAKSFTDTLKATEFSLDAKALIDVRAEGKNLAEELEAQLQGVPGAFVFAFRSAFIKLMTGLGSELSTAIKFVEEEFKKFTELDESVRTQAGLDFLKKIEAFIDLANVASGQLGNVMEPIRALAKDIGFAQIPSINELKEYAQELIRTATATPEATQKLITLHDAILQLRDATINTLSGIVGTMSELGSKLKIGGAGEGALKTAIAKIDDLLKDNTLSLEQREILLRQQYALANQIDQIEAARRQKEADAIGLRISALQKEADWIRELTEKRINALQEELRITKDMEQEQKRIADTIMKITYGGASPLTPIEQLNRIQADIQRAERQAREARTPEERLDVIAQIREMSETAFELGSRAFGEGDAGFQALFKQVVARLEQLQGATTTRRTSVEIQAEIERLQLKQNETLERIQKTIETLQGQQNIILEQQSLYLRSIYQGIYNGFNSLVNPMLKRLDELTKISTVPRDYATTNRQTNINISVEPKVTVEVKGNTSTEELRQNIIASMISAGKTSVENAIKYDPNIRNAIKNIR